MLYLIPAMLDSPVECFDASDCDISFTSDKYPAANVNDAVIISNTSTCDGSAFVSAVQITDTAGAPVFTISPGANKPEQTTAICWCLDCYIDGANEVLTNFSHKVGEVKHKDNPENTGVPYVCRANEDMCVAEYTSYTATVNTNDSAVLIDSTSTCADFTLIVDVKAVNLDGANPKFDFDLSQSTTSKLYSICWCSGADATTDCSASNPSGTDNTHSTLIGAILRAPSMLTTKIDCHGDTCAATFVTADSSDVALISMTNDCDNMTAANVFAGPEDVTGTTFSFIGLDALTRPSATTTAICWCHGCSGNPTNVDALTIKIGEVRHFDVPPEATTQFLCRADESDCVIEFDPADYKTPPNSSDAIIAIPVSEACDNIPYIAAHSYVDISGNPSFTLTFSTTGREFNLCLCDGSDGSTKCYIPLSSSDASNYFPWHVGTLLRIPSMISDPIDCFNDICNVSITTDRRMQLFY
eukprot:GHVL01000563.1.p1 GENE.GHVL01000563.1~~GHVL01000563.1.p1  ORF type:complete len:470 (-),score=64.74 GHVL01000563.1:876-2285(-)